MTDPQPRSTRGRRPAPRPRPLSPEELTAADRVARRLQEELRALLGELPVEERGASALARRLELDRATCQRAVAAAEAPAADASLLTRTPGVQGLRQLVDALAEAGARPGPVAEAQAAVDQFAELLKSVGGSQSRLSRRLEITAASSAPAPDAASRQRHRETLFEAALGVTGRCSDVSVAVFMYRPVPGEPDRMETVVVSGLIGHAARPDAVPLILQTESRDSDSTRRDFRTLDSAPARGRTPSAILEDFSTRPLPLVTSSGPDGLLVQSIDPSAAAKGPVDVVLARRPGGNSPHPATESPPLHEVWTLQHFPARHLVLDVLLHRDLATCSIPAAELHLVRPGFEEQAGHRWMTRFPESPRLEVLGPGLRGANPTAWPRQRELLLSVLERVGWPADEMVGYRVEEPYPVWRAGYLVSLDFGASRPAD